MSKSYTPGLKILENTSFIKERLLPLSGKVHVNKDELVNADKIIASTKIPGNIQMINIANELNIDPDQVMGCMLCNVDDKVSKGQVIARSKGLFGLFKSEVKSPLDGILGNISEITGQVIISEEPIPIEIDAYIPGKIDKVIDKEGTIISSHGALIQGIIGIGGEKKGYIKIVDKEVVSETDFTDDMKNKIIVIPSYLSYSMYNEVIKIGADGVICGGVDYSTLTQILGRPLGVAITGMEEVPTIIITEGFGNIHMALKTFNLLKKYDGKFASINGATQIRAGVMRPEIFIGAKDAGTLTTELEFSEEDLVIEINSKVRVIREPNFGKIGNVTKLPSDLLKMDTETMARAAEIEFEDGSKEIIPRSNLEVILSD